MRPHQNNSFLVLVEVVTVTMVISTFVSHTVAALILMPMIVEVGGSSLTPHFALQYAALSAQSCRAICSCCSFVLSVPTTSGCMSSTQCASWSLHSNPRVCYPSC